MVLFLFNLKFLFFFFFKLYFISFWPCCMVCGDCPWPGIEPRPMAVKVPSPYTGLPGNSHEELPFTIYGHVSPLVTNFPNFHLSENTFISPFIWFILLKYTIDLQCYFCCTAVVQLYTNMIHILCHISLMVYHKILNIVPCAIQYHLYFWERFLLSIKMALFQHSKGCHAMVFLTFRCFWWEINCSFYSDSPGCNCIFLPLIVFSFNKKLC